MFSDFSQIFSLGTSKVFSICPEEFWGVFLGERVLLQHLWTLSKKMKHFGKSFIGKVVKLSFTCPKQQFIRICRWKKNKISLVLRQGAMEISDGSTEFSNRIVKLALWVTGGIVYGKRSNFLSAMTLRH